MKSKKDDKYEEDKVNKQDNKLSSPVKSGQRKNYIENDPE